jgi:cell division septal protein FtsQ
MDAELLQRRHRRITAIGFRTLWRWGGSVCGGLAVLWIGHGMILKTDRFELIQFKVSGTFHIRSQGIRAIFEPALHRSLLTLDLEPFMQELLDHPWVRDVRIKKVLPDTLWIHIQERVPVAVVESRGEFHWVDAEGVVLGSSNPAKDSRSKPLPHIRGVNLYGLMRRDPDPLNRLRAGVTLIELIKSHPVSHSTGLGLEDSLVLDLSHGEKDPRLYLEGYTLRFGEGAYEEKWKSFLAVYEDLRDRDLAPEEIDLRFMDQVIVKTF